MQKRWLLFVLLMAFSTARAQPLQLSAADVSAFSKAMIKAYTEDKNGFRQFFSRVLGENVPQFNLQQTISQTGTSRQVMENVLYTSYLRIGKHAGHKKYLTSLMVPPQSVNRLAEYALYVFARKENEYRGHALEGQQLFRGAKLFRDPENVWYYLVIAEDGDIEFRSYPAPGNTYYKDKSKPDEVVRGRFSGKRITIGHSSRDYIFLNGVLGTLNEEGAYNEFFECTPAGKYVWGEPKFEFADVSFSDFTEAGERIKKNNLPPIVANRDEDEPKQVATFVEVNPDFPGGADSLFAYITRNLRYPKVALERGISGTVFVSFIIGPEGKIQDIKTVGASKGGGLEEEAMRVIREMPRWKPALISNKPVGTQMNLPIRFTIPE